MKLIKMTDFCLEILNENSPYNEVEMLTKISNYANFLKQPLTLEMFVPVDEEGNVLEKPKLTVHHEAHFDLDEMEIYHKAQEKVLFSNAVTVDETPYNMVSRFVLNLNHPTYLLIYSKFTFHDGIVETQFLPNFSKNPTVEYLVDYGLDLTPSAIKLLKL